MGDACGGARLVRTPSRAGSTAPLDLHSSLAVQRSLGNAGLARLVTRPLLSPDLLLGLARPAGNRALARQILHAWDLGGLTPAVAPKRVTLPSDVRDPLSSRAAWLHAQSPLRPYAVPPGTAALARSSGLLVQRWPDALPGRLVGTPLSYDVRRVIAYWGGWIADIVDLWSKGYVYDTISLMYSVLGSTAAPVLARVEEVLRFVQNHPELMQAAGYGAPVIAAYCGVPTWVAQLILSRGEASDLIGSIMLSVIPEAVLAYMPTWLLAGLTRRGGRSFLNRFLGVASSVGGWGAWLVSGASRVAHGFGITHGDLTPGPAPQLPGHAFWFDHVARALMPVERLHTIPARRGGPMTEANAPYGASGTNTLMIPLEAQNIPATAIRTPAGHLEAMVMNGGLFLGRGVRPVAGSFEKWLADVGLA